MDNLAADDEEHGDDVSGVVPLGGELGGCEGGVELGALGGDDGEDSGGWHCVVCLYVNVVVTWILIKTVFDEDEDDCGNLNESAGF